MPLYTPEEWIQRLNQGMRNHSIMLAVGAGILILVSYLATTTTHALMRSVRAQRDQAGNASNPVLDRFLDDDDTPRRAQHALEEDSVAFAKRMAEVKAQFGAYNNRLLDVSARHGVDVTQDRLGEQVFDKENDEYVRK